MTQWRSKDITIVTTENGVFAYKFKRKSDFIEFIMKQHGLTKSQVKDNIVDNGFSWDGTLYYRVRLEKYPKI